MTSRPSVSDRAREILDAAAYQWPESSHDIIASDLEVTLTVSPPDGPPFRISGTWVTVLRDVLAGKVSE